jgi:hypothetical protein
MIARMRELLEKHNESYREATLDSGLDHQAVRRILTGKRPNMITCILLADHFQVNPNEFLQLGGWPILKTFDIQTASAEKLPPEAAETANYQLNDYISLRQAGDSNFQTAVATIVITDFRQPGRVQSQGN